MLASEVYALRDATPADEPALAALAAWAGQRPIALPAVIAEVGGLATAAISLRDRRVICDEYQDCAALAAILRATAARRELRAFA